MTLRLFVSSIWSNIFNIFTIFLPTLIQFFSKNIGFNRGNTNLEWVEGLLALRRDGGWVVLTIRTQASAHSLRRSPGGTSSNHEPYPSLSFGTLGACEGPAPEAIELNERDIPVLTVSFAPAVLFPRR